MFDLDAWMSSTYVAFTGRIESFLRAVLPSKWTLLLSFFLVMQFHVLPFFAEDSPPSPATARFRSWFKYNSDHGNVKANIVGLNLLVFQIYYTAHIQQITVHAPLFFVVVGIFYNQYVLYRLRNRLASCGRLLKDKKVGDVGSEYMVFAGSVSKAVFLGMAQFVLMVYYGKTLHTALSHPDFSKVSCLTWVLGVLVILAAGDELGLRFSMVRWDYVELAYRWILLDKYDGGNGEHWRSGMFTLVPDLEELSEGVQRSEASESTNVILTKKLQQIWFRVGIPPLRTIDPYLFFKFLARKHMDFSINCIARLVILSTAPLLISTEEEFEVLKDCTAIFFIVKLDDVATIAVDKMIDNFVEEYKTKSEEVDFF